MKQVFLSRGSTHQVVCVPAQFAIRGAYLRILDEDGWRVDEVYSVGASLATSDRRNLRGLFGSLA
jgi:hypothetical protein